MNEHNPKIAKSSQGYNIFDPQIRLTGQANTITTMSQTPNNYS